MYKLFRKVLFLLPAEASHDLALLSLSIANKIGLLSLVGPKVESKAVTVMGIEFPNKVGLAAGLDKNGECIDAFAAMGFGFIEVGTVTPVAQAGNDKPRMFRLPQSKAIINRMGFNNKGVDYLINQVKRAEYNGVLGINIGKNKNTPEENALEDYLTCFRKVYEHASYVTINISSPNTPGLRNLQYGEALNTLLSGLKLEQEKLADKHGKYVPTLVKIAPDLNDDEIVSISDSFVNAGIDGVIATNTTLDRTMVAGQEYADESGGLSGSVLCSKSQQVSEKLHSALNGAMPVIGVGGIDSVSTASARISAGSPLIQIYSSLIYQGPRLIKEIVDSL